MPNGTKWLSSHVLAVLCAAALAPVAAVADPVVTGITPNAGPLMSFATVYGSDFGDAQGMSYVLLGGRPVPILAWSPGAISIYVNPMVFRGVPLALDRFYPVQVVTPPKTSNAAFFLLTSGAAPPYNTGGAIAGPSDQPTFECFNKQVFCPGDFMIIYGSGFGSFQGMGFVTINVPFAGPFGSIIFQEFPVPVISWTETAIYVVLNLPPGALLNRTYLATVHRGNGKTTSGYFTVINCAQG